MKEGQLFRVKVIKDESDLPKEEGWFFVHVIKTGIDIMEWDFSSSPDYVKLQNEDWLNTVDWYLEEYTPKSTLENKDFFEQKIKDEITDTDIEAWVMDGYSLCSDVYILGILKGAKSMRDGLIKHKESDEFDPDQIL